MDEALQKLIEAVETLSPEMWRIAQAQVEVEVWRLTIGLYFFSVLVAMCLLLLIFGSIKVLSTDDRFSNNWGGVICWSFFFFVGSSIVDLILYFALVARKMNPDYYAIQVLMSLVP